MEKIQAYKTSDGSLFEDLKKAAKHDVSYKWLTHICDFLKSNAYPHKDDTFNTIVIEAILAWENYRVRFISHCTEKESKTPKAGHAYLNDVPVNDPNVLRQMGCTHQTPYAHPCP